MISCDMYIHLDSSVAGIQCIVNTETIILTTDMYYMESIT